MKVNITKNKDAIRLIILDDEIEACYNLKNILDKYFERHNLEIVGICQNTKDAEKMIESLQPDALFIDIEMHTETAFQFLERIAPFSFELIFVTAYDEFAIKAFKLNAVDYILKPISIDELEQAIEKLKFKIHSTRLIKSNNYFNELSQDFNAKKLPDCIKLSTLGRIDIIPFENIFFIEGKGAYSIFHFKEEDEYREVLVSHSISEYEQMLPNHLFFRTHKSYLVNCSHIKKVFREPNYEILLHNNTKLVVGRRRMSMLQAFLDKNS
jgi:two-component system, LytTR family, response regulator